MQLFNRFALPQLLAVTVNLAPFISTAAVNLVERDNRNFATCPRNGLFGQPYMYCKRNDEALAEECCQHFRPPTTDEPQQPQSSGPSSNIQIYPAIFDGQGAPKPGHTCSCVYAHGGLNLGDQATIDRMQWIAAPVESMLILVISY